MTPLATKPIISIKEARKILGPLANELTNEELALFIAQLEQIARLGVRDYMVRKNANISLVQAP